MFVYTVYYFQTELIAWIHRKGSLAQLIRNGGERAVKAGVRKGGLCPWVSGAWKEMRQWTADSEF